MKAGCKETTNKHHLFTRNGIYWLRYRKTFKDDKGNIELVNLRESLETRNLEDAKKRRDDKLREYQLKDRNELRENLLKNIRHDEEKIAAIQNSRNKTSIAEAWAKYDDYVSVHKNRPKTSTFRQYEIQWECFTRKLKEIAPKKQYLEDVTKEDAETYLQGISKKITPNTYNKTLRTLRGVFKTIWKDRPDIENPFHDFEIKSLETTSHRPLTETELKAVCSKATGELKILIAIGFFTALRLKDAALLKWENVSFRNGMITAIPAKTSRKNKIVNIPIHPVLKAVLLEIYTTDAKGYILPGMAADYLKDPTRITNMIQEHFKACGIDTQYKDGKKKAICIAGFHSLRHSQVSILASKGTAQAVSMALVGHGSPEIHRVYTSIEQDALRKAVNTLPDISGADNPAIEVKAEQMPGDLEKRIAEALELIGLANEKDISETFKKRLLSTLK
jgi:integrase